MKHFIDYYKALLPMYVDNIRNIGGGGTIVSSHVIDDGIWNFVYIKEKSLQKIEKIFNKSKLAFQDRIPIIKS